MSRSADPSASSSAAAPKPGLTVAAGSRAALRDQTATGPFTDGLALEARALISRPTDKDGLGVAIRFVREATPSKPNAYDSESVDSAAALSALRFEIKAPDGTTHALEPAPVAPSRSSLWELASFVQSLSLDGNGMTVGSAQRAWKSPVAGLFGKAGTYAMTLSGTFTTSTRSVTLRSGTLRFDVVAAGEQRKALVDLERAASETARARRGAKGIPIPSDPTVDDVDGNLVVRFLGSGVDGNGVDGDGGYSDSILEVWVDPAGKVLVADAYEHFNCIAEGTAIETPRGPVPIERITVGSEVDAFDVETGRRAIAVVTRADRGHAASLVAFGDLLVTGEHPIWADGSWVRAADVVAGATLLGIQHDARSAIPVIVHAPHVVFDLTVSAPHTYFAGGVLVHNKAVGVPLGGPNRPWGRLFFRHAAK